MDVYNLLIEYLELEFNLRLYLDEHTHLNINVDSRTFVFGTVHAHVSISCAGSYLRISLQKIKSSFSHQ